MAEASQLSIAPEAFAGSLQRRSFNGSQNGEVFTRRWVVDLILDLVGFTPDLDLSSKVILEPSCGGGAFLLPIAERTIESFRLNGVDPAQAVDVVRAYDLLPQNVLRSREHVAARLKQLGVDGPTARLLAEAWITQSDFLLFDHDFGSADFVVGNPPYIRLENVSPHLMEAYRRACPTMRGRSDIYVGFIETGLRLLKPEGKLGFICADRWMRNQYGSALRDMIAAGYAVDTVVSMHDVDAFEQEVSAYPAVTILRNGPQGAADVATADGRFNEETAKALRSWLSRPARKDLLTDGLQAARLPSWFDGTGLWPAGSPAHIRLVSDIEKRFPPLESPDTGTRVGIGVATGCDDVYIRDDPSLVEPDRLLPLLLASDTTTGHPNWSGRYLVNPWNCDGLVDLGDYPRLRDYMEVHAERLRSRHVARKRPRSWYRTIDRVDPELRRRPKILLPDLKAESHPILDVGNYYPHHNLYYVVSNDWDLEVLGGILLSDVANLFVGAYCVKMRGGCYRFQAQYLRRVRLPRIDTISARDAKRLAKAFRYRDRAEATRAAASVYGIELHELQIAAGAARSD